MLQFFFSSVRHTVHLIYLSVCMSLFLSFSLSSYVYFFLSIHLGLFFCLYLHFYLSTRPPVWLSISLPLCLLRVCFCRCLSLALSVSLCRSVILPVSLSVSLSLSVHWPEVASSRRRLYTARGWCAASLTQCRTSAVCLSGRGETGVPIGSSGYTELGHSARASPVWEKNSRKWPLHYIHTHETIKAALKPYPDNTPTLVRRTKHFPVTLWATLLSPIVLQKLQ